VFPGGEFAHSITEENQLPFAADHHLFSALEAVAHVQRYDSIVLFGVEPSAARADYGWITLDPSEVSTGVRSVAAFVEKPSTDAAGRLWSAGAVWNTMVIVAQARTLFRLCGEQLPDLTDAFADCFMLPQEARERLLADRYWHLAAHDFSRDVLTPARKLSAYIWPASMGWSDLGTPERLAQWLDGRSVCEAQVAWAAIAS
jgi:mannose-1-phosphate guanylyltransferase